VETVKSDLQSTFDVQLQEQVGTQVAATMYAMQPTQYIQPMGVGGTMRIYEPFAATLTEVMNPASDDLIMTDANTVPDYCAQVDLSNFMMQATFTNPSGLSTDKWDYGVFFFDQGTNQQLRINVYDGYWYLHDGVNDFVNSGYLTMDLGDARTNTLQLYVYQGQAYIYMNQQQQAVIDVSQYGYSHGDVCVVAWVYKGDPMYYTIHFDDFTVWSIN
jgi:hypothetical protein